MLSKPKFPIGVGIDPNTYTNEFIEIKDNNILSYETYKKSPNVLSSYHVPQLKQIAKYYKLGVSGTKTVLFCRIENYFNKCMKSTSIQRIFRGYLIRQCFRNRGKGFYNRSLCVNESDFYTLEPISEIPFEYFFSFCCGKIWYGCNIVSLMHLIQSTPIMKNPYTHQSVIKNPYTRESFSQEAIEVIKNVYSMVYVIFGIPNDAPKIKTIPPRPTMMFSIPNIGSFVITIEMMEQRILRLRTMRSKSISERSQTLFMEIDQLGNYTHEGWFSSLERREYIRLFRTLHDIWTYRGQLSQETKMLICILEDPFIEINRERIYLHEAHIDVIKDTCLRVMENMVYNGIDDEYRKIGALHVLTALTAVSMGARNALPWLYDALYY